ncbi:MAG: NAD(+)/NADH kinase [Thermomicrobiales bacterium]
MKIGLVAAQSKSEASTLALEIATWLAERGATVVPETELSFNAYREVDAVVVLGGDGLMMRAANAYPDTPLLGINFGKVGFLALVERKDWKLALSAVLAGDYEIEESSTLAASLERAGQKSDQGWAINDVVIRGESRMIDIEVYIDGHFVNTYPGDGMIVSTPRGSTAYCMAAGGPILTAGVKGFAIVPISCHSPIRTPFVVSESVQTELLLASRHSTKLILDGRQTTDLQLGDVVKVNRGIHTFRQIALGSTDFYEAFRTKFNFQIRPGAVPSRRPPIASLKQ